MDSLQHSATTLSAEEVKRILGLTPHPREGGWFVRTYESGEMLPLDVFADGRYSGARHTGTAIYYLLEPDTFSEMHLLRSDELFHFYMGDAVEMLHLRPDGTGDTVRIGSDLAAGERPQVLVPRGVWQGSRLARGGRWALLGCTVVPGFDFADYTSATRAALIADWPAFADEITKLTREGDGSSPDRQEDAADA
ncbi:MAG: cupin domain-containing protein [Acidobacteriota bacterium]|nr:cupin domain-containing protein [Acidobacteriota bacterium]